MFQKKIHTKVTYDIPFDGPVTSYTLSAYPTDTEPFSLTLKSTYYTDRLPHDSDLVYEFRDTPQGLALTRILSPTHTFIYWEGTNYLWENKP